MADRPRSHREDDRTRSTRSRSPRRHQSHAHRARSPHRHHHRRKRSTDEAAPAKDLPYNARMLTKHDYTVFEPMFGLYLDIQKSRILEDMDETEVKGRWKSFIGKW